MKFLKVEVSLLSVIAFCALFTFSNSTKDSTFANSVLDHQALTSQLDQLLQSDPNLQGALIGVSIRSASTGEIIYDHLGDTRLRPASNMKLLTAASALSVLGENFSFVTEVTTDGSINGNTLDGNLFLKGKGDPTLLKSDFEKIAKVLRQSGLKVIQGDLIADDSWYDDVRYSPDLIWSDEHTYYGGQVSALTVSPNKDYDAGSVIVDIAPGTETGSDATITVTPKTDYVSIENNVITVPANTKKDITIIRQHGTNNIIIKGTIPESSPIEREWISVWEPTGYALNLFKQSLKKYGIIWTGIAKVGESDDQTSRLVTHSSMPLSELLIPFMKLSNNGHAEVLLKEMGKVSEDEGSWDSGIKVLEREIAKFSVNPDTLVIRDGSGISHINLIPANELSKLLYTIQEESWFPVYLNSLPIAGENNRTVGGTLGNRLTSASSISNIHAKTGTISTVSGLSGYIETKSGEQLIFSILLNNLVDESKGKKVEDSIVSLLAKQ
ncbi:D-alanyl-D-alanine carboxypeptidase/D-alanyl-D-alanine-endopeptidase [Aquibacillus halophilus]|nr:D-alanyl-D-alanine carboxypeptidase/D-alanyl-D-alanine-endopeptidase [Aquibacillus halophilus]